MKKARYLFLVLVLMLNIGTYAYAGNITRINTESGFSALDWGGGAADTVDLGEVSPGASFTALIPANGAFQNAADDAGYVKREARSLSVKIKGRKNSNVLSGASIVYETVSGVNAAHLKISFIRTFPARGSNDLAFEFEALPVIDGRTYSQKGVTFKGTFKNDGSYRRNPGSRSVSVITSGNVSSGGFVSPTTIRTEAIEALKGAEDTAILRTKNAESILASTLESLAGTARKAGKDIVLHADSFSLDGELIGRLYVEPAKLTRLKTELMLGISTAGAQSDFRKSQFNKVYTNNIAVISCAQQGSFGANLKIAAKAGLPKNTSNLTFYSYDLATNKCTKIETAYRVDKNGYIHFTTDLAGDIIISDGPLKRKN